MKVEKIVETIIKNPELNFKGSLKSINENNNPYSDIISKKISELKIPVNYSTSIEIEHKDDILKITFKYFVDIEAKEKIKVLALKKNEPFYECYIKKDNRIFKDLLTSKELKLDYNIDNALKLKNKKDEIKFVNSLNINFKEIYQKSLEKFINEYLKPYISKKNQDKILNEFFDIDDIKLLLISEDPESIDDTMPREIIYKELLKLSKKLKG